MFLFTDVNWRISSRTFPLYKEFNFFPKYEFRIDSS